MSLSTHRRLSICLVVGVLGFAFLTLPLGTGMEFSGDERFELAKGFAYIFPGRISPDFWNDQPALYSALLGFLFRTVSPSLLLARCVALGMTVLLAWSIWMIAAERAGRVAAWFALSFLLISPEILTIVLPVLAEVPAFALALSAMVAVDRWRRRPSWICLLTSAALFACGLHVKLTSAIVLPWLLIELCTPPIGPGMPLLHGRFTSLLEGFVRRCLITPFVWTTALLGVFQILSLIPPGVNWNLLWTSHSDAGQVQEFRTLDVFRFSPEAFFGQQIETVCLAVVGFYVQFWHRRWRSLVFPAGLLLTALSVHALHRPWWWYYSIHFAIPLAILAGMGTAAVIRAMPGRAFQGSLQAKRLRQVAVSTGLAAMIAWVVSAGTERVSYQVRWLRDAERVKSCTVLNHIRRFAPYTRWFYSLDCQYSFYGRVTMPPELTIIPTKRVLTGDLDFRRILQYVRRYQPEQLLLTTPQELCPEWIHYVNQSYIKVYEDQRRRLYVLRSTVDRVAQDTPDPSHAFLRRR